MASVNKVFLLGNLTREPELKYTADGHAVANFGLAVNRKFKRDDEWKEEVCFVDIVVWGKQAENCSEYLHKGSSAFIEGRLDFRTWETDQGQKRSKLEVTAFNVQFLSKPKGNGGEESGRSDGPSAGVSDSTEGNIPS